jgi:probable addiction module antidote protein
MTRKPRSLDADYRDKRKMLAKFLNDALASDDTIVFVKAIGDLIRAQGMTEVSQKTGLNRAALYISFGGNKQRGMRSMPNIDRVVRTVAALQLKIVIRPIGRS